MYPAIPETSLYNSAELLYALFALPDSSRSPLEVISPARSPRGVPLKGHRCTSHARKTSFWSLSSEIREAETVDTPHAQWMRPPSPLSEADRPVSRVGQLSLSQVAGYVTKYIALLIMTFQSKENQVPGREAYMLVLSAFEYSMYLSSKRAYETVQQRQKSRQAVC